jgi:hypothetical protein
MKFVLIAMISISAFAQVDWELKKDKDGIKVYLANSEDSKIKQFKVETFVKATPREIADAIVDLENNYKWFLNVEKAELIKRLSQDAFIFKQIIQVPFPFKNREVVEYCAVKEMPNGVIRIDLKEDNTFVPETDEYVRMPISRGYWILTPAQGGTAIEYSFLADPGGNIPPWLANQFIVSNPLKTITNLREYLEK